MKNEMNLEFLSISENESLARVTVAAFVSQLDPTMEEITDIKTVVSEAVTNSIIHGYNEKKDGKVLISCRIDEGRLEITIQDHGIGIGDVDEAREPLFTSKPELERSGMGFTIMENFMDEVDITSNEGQGTTVRMFKQLITNKALCN
ncbi:anti-sigma F factor [Thalassobacillus sp. CUG 92003]|uniref:anti-sigma F factor n=1 Tax=Thalassobacillus sp. CUG 92003 TaxID=2736641 RepID=UPI0015E7917B|nr:anti-sigma F factor [Thalassobacillus sp. CUG 92003]